MSVLLALIAGAMVVFGLVLAAVSLISFARFRGVRMLMVSLAFMLLFLKGCVLGLAAFGILFDYALACSALLDLFVLLLLAVSILKP